MSLVMYAGAGQYMAIGLFAAGAHLGTIVVSMLLLNIRHIVYGLSLLRQYHAAGPGRFYLVFALTDETYALLTTAEPPSDIPPSVFYVAIAALNQSYWVLGSLIGALAATIIPFDFAGVDFALTALFAVLLIEQIRSTHRILPPLIGAAATLAALLFVPPAHVLLASLALGVAALTLIYGRRHA
jgi:4-azaleucine resistance transporter AzlC